MTKEIQVKNTAELKTQYSEQLEELKERGNKPVFFIRKFGVSQTLDELINVTLEYEAANKNTNIDIKAFMDDNDIVKGKELLEDSFNQIKNATNQGCTDENIKSVIYHANIIDKIYNDTNPNFLDSFLVPNRFTLLSEMEIEDFNLVIDYLESSIKKD